MLSTNMTKTTGLAPKTLSPGPPFGVRAAALFYCAKAKCIFLGWAETGARGMGMESEGNG